MDATATNGNCGSGLICDGGKCETAGKSLFTLTPSVGEGRDGKTTNYVYLYNLCSLSECSCDASLVYDSQGACKIPGTSRIETMKWD